MRTVKSNYGQSCILSLSIIYIALYVEGGGILTFGGMYGTPLGHHAIVTALHLIGSGDGIVALMSLDINAHTQAVKKS